MNRDFIKNVNWREEHGFQKRNSGLMQAVSVGDSDVDKLTIYEGHARYITRNIEIFGEKVGRGRVINGSMARKFCFANTGDDRVDGCTVLRTIERLANGEVYYKRDMCPHTVFFPKETIEEIKEIKNEKSKDMRQRMLDSFENENDIYENYENEAIAD